MHKKIFLLSTLTISLLALTPEESRLQQIQNFNLFKAQTNRDFKSYKTEQQDAFREYKSQIGAIWKKPILSSKKSWVEYTKDKKTRSEVDFEKEIITLKTIDTSKENARKKLTKALQRVVTIDTKTLQESDPLQVKLSKIAKEHNKIDIKVKKEPILSTLIFDKTPTPQSIKNYLDAKVLPKDIKSQKSKKVLGSNVYTLKIKMPKDSMIKRSYVYADEIKKQSKVQKIPQSLIFAIMHTESNFNPRARSHIPAFGLMQIVPKSAGIDAYLYLYKKKKLVTGNYLYNSTNNIKMGSAYLHILYYRYLRKIKDPQSRLYCTIAAYNTGAGNIAWAFTKKYNMNHAAPLINKMSAEEVYAKLLKDLRFQEPKNYLRRVKDRMQGYKKIHG